MARALIFFAFLFGVVIGNLTCSSKPTVDVSVDPAGTATDSSDPVIQIEPAQRMDSQLMLTGETANLSLTAPGATNAELYFLPVTASDRALRLKTIPAFEDGKFALKLNLPKDLNGEIWARVTYPNGEVRETERLQVARVDEISGNAASPTPAEQPAENGNPPRAETQDKPADTDDSVREDKRTGGNIQRGSLRQGGGIRVTVNVPAFLMTLWQDGKEIATYHVGVGRKQFPIPIGMRSAKEIILNPDWIPPDSEWVRKSEHEPYERIPADDPENPLGKIKIPLGEAYLLHEAQGPSDIGNLVSHGCVRVMRDDIFDLAKKIALGRGLDVSSREIEAARGNSTRRVIDLKGDLEVDINYDTLVVEGGKLQILPDVYEKGMNTVDKLKQELESYGVDTSALPQNKLKEMLAKVEKDKKFVIPIASLRAGKTEDGKVEPLIPQSKRS